MIYQANCYKYDIFWLKFAAIRVSRIISEDGSRSWASSRGPINYETSGINDVNLIPLPIHFIQLYYWIDALHRISVLLPRLLRKGYQVFTLHRTSYQLSKGMNLTESVYWHLPRRYHQVYFYHISNPYKFTKRMSRGRVSNINLK